MAALDQHSDPVELYRIGAVAQLTGIAVERLRAWERRYGLAPSQKTGKTRFYSTEQVRWLQSVKALIDQGQTISSLIDLSQAQLEQRLGQQPRPGPQAQSASGDESIAVDLVGTGLLLLEAQQGRGRGGSPGATPVLAVASRATDADQWLARRDQQPAAIAVDLVIVQTPTLDHPVLLQLRDALGSTPLLVLYEFATANQLADLESDGFEYRQWPISWTTLVEQGATLLGRPLRARQRAPRRFDDDELLALASETGAAGTDPELSAFPAHLARLITELNGFLDFADRTRRSAVIDSRRPPLPAAAHDQMTTDVSQARAQLETALGAVVDGYRLD